MSPTLYGFELGGRIIALPSYGFAVTLGFAVGVWLAARQARRAGLDRNAVLDVGFWGLVAGLVGSRLLFVAQHAGEFAGLCAGDGSARPLGRVIADCAAFARIWDGGLVFYGGALAAAATAALLARRRGLPFARLADLYAPSVALGHVFGRIGCFAAGCCYGKACAAGLGVAFPPGSLAYELLLREGALPPGAARTPPLHATQLYEAAGELAIFALLLAWRRRQRFHGELALVYAVAYAGLRAAVELFRGDSTRRFLVELATPALSRALGLPETAPLFLSTSQAVSLVVGAAALALIARQRRRLAGST